MASEKTKTSYTSAYRQSGIAKNTFKIYLKYLSDTQNNFNKFSKMKKKTKFICKCIISSTYK